MLIKELTWRGLLIWPPQWAEDYPDIIEHGLLKDVDILSLTELIKVDAKCGGTIVSGLVLSNEKYRGPLYYKLKENIGKSLYKIGNLEVNF